MSLTKARATAGGRSSGLRVVMSSPDDPLKAKQTHKTKDGNDYENGAQEPILHEPASSGRSWSFSNGPVWPDRQPIGDVVGSNIQVDDRIAHRATILARLALQGRDLDMLKSRTVAGTLRRPFAWA